MCFGIPTFDAGVKQQMFSIITHIYILHMYMFLPSCIYIYMRVCLHILRRSVIYIPIKTHFWLTHAAVKDPVLIQQRISQVGDASFAADAFSCVGHGLIEHPMEPQIGMGWVWNMIFCNKT